MTSNSIELIATLILVAIIIVALAFWNVISGFMQCNSYESMTDRQTRFSIVSGCYVKTEKGWIPREEMSKRAIANDVQTN